MKLKIVKDVEFPRDVTEDYRPVWDAFLNMKAVSQLRVYDNSNKAVPECFRILINQAGAKTRLAHKVTDFVDVRKPSGLLRGFLRKTNILDHMRVQSHQQTVLLSEAAGICAAFEPTFVGTVVLRPQRFDLKYLIQRTQGLLYKVMPIQLMETMPNGDKRKFPKLKTMRDRDFFIAFESPDLRVLMARTEKDLIIKYEAKFGVIVPLYQRLDVALKGLWRKSMMGVFA